MAELGRKPFFGIAASLLLLILAIAILTDGIQFQSGMNVISTDSLQNSNSSSNSTAYSFTDNASLTSTNTSTLISGTTALISKNATTTYLYTEMPEITPVIPIKQLLWLFMTLLSIYGLFAYATEIKFSS